MGRPGETHPFAMADDDNSAADPEASGTSDWLKFLGLVGAAGGVSALIYGIDKHLTKVKNLEHSVDRLQSSREESQRERDEALDRLAELARERISQEAKAVSAQFEAKVDERVEKRLGLANERFIKRLEQISDTSASAVEQLLREGQRRMDEIMAEYDRRLKHIDWLAEQSSPSVGDARPSADDEDPVWSGLDDFQRRFKT